MDYFVGLDLGQATDYTAIAVLEEQVYVPLAGGWVSWPTLSAEHKHLLKGELGYHWRKQRPSPPPLHVRHLQRWPLGTSYVQIVADVAELMKRPPLNSRAYLIPDKTGVGAPVIDMFWPHGFMTMPVVITGGATTSFDKGAHVPKRELISATQVLLQSGRLKIAADLPEAQTLVSELQNYRVKVTEAANETFNAREGKHDDLVLAVALACWWYSRTNGKEI